MTRSATGLVVTSLFLERIVDGLYQGLGRDLPQRLVILGALLVAFSVYCWFWSYSQEYRIPWVMDMGWFVLTIWVFLLPYYVIRAEGRSGWSRIGLFCMTYFAAYATGWAVLIWTQVLVGDDPW